MTTWASKRCGPRPSSGASHERAYCHRRRTWYPTVESEVDRSHRASVASRRRRHYRGPRVDRRIFGLENEYGVTCTLRGQRRLSPDEVARYLFRRVVSWGRSSNVFLENGARLYLDVGSHPEYATPECDSIADLVVHDKAGERILEAPGRRAEARLREEGIRGVIYLFKNNTDSAGNSYGCHENYLTSRRDDFAPLHRGADPVPRHPADLRRCRARSCRRPAGRCSAFASGPSTSGRACRRRPPGAGRSSTPATSPTPTPSASAGCTSSSATRT